MIDQARVLGMFALLAFGGQAGRSPESLVAEMLGRWPDVTDDEFAAVVEKLRKLDRDLSMMHEAGHA